MRPIFFVIAGLDPAIHEGHRRALFFIMDHRVTPARLLCSLRVGPVMTKEF
jgi:hypothetical protein